jgi:hypothetical protein
VGGAGADGVSTLGEGLGGGIMNVNGASLTILNSTITSNQAIGGANATPTTAVPLAGGALGGGIENLRSSTLTIVNSTLTDNVARGGSSTVGLGGTAVAAASTTTVPPR